MHPLFLFVFILFPLAELLVFINVAAKIGFFTAFFLILFSLFVGVALIRAQGMRTLLTLNRTMQSGRISQEAVSAAFGVALAGVLFALPGFISDAIGLLVLIPPLRYRLQNAVTPPEAPKSDSSILEGEYERTDE